MATFVEIASRDFDASTNSRQRCSNLDARFVSSSSRTYLTSRPIEQLLKLNDVNIFSRGARYSVFGPARTPVLANQDLLTRRREMM
jgi:hypothetical protein